MRKKPLIVGFAMTSSAVILDLNLKNQLGTIPKNFMRLVEIYLLCATQPKICYSFICACKKEVTYLKQYQ